MPDASLPTAPDLLTLHGSRRADGRMQLMQKRPGVLDVNRRFDNLLSSCVDDAFGSKAADCENSLLTNWRLLITPLRQFPMPLCTQDPMSSSAAHRQQVVSPSKNPLAEPPNRQAVKPPSPSQSNPSVTDCLRRSESIYAAVNLAIP